MATDTPKAYVVKEIAYGDLSGDLILEFRLSTGPIERFAFDEAQRQALREALDTHSRLYRGPKASA